MTLTPTPLEHEVRALFLAHEHLAVAGRPARLAAVARLAQRRHRRTRAVTAVAALGTAAALVALLAGTWAGRPAPAPQPGARVVPAGLSAWEESRALHLLDRADSDAGLPPKKVALVGLRLQLVGSWGADDADREKAWTFHELEAATALPTEAPADGAVTWEGGSASVALISANDALRQATLLKTPCATCTPLKVTAARLTTTVIETRRGPATTPAWEFTLAGTDVRVRFAAIARSDFTDLAPTEAWDNDHFVVGIEGATVAPDGMALTLSFSGAAAASTGPCGSDYRVVAAESAAAVVPMIVAVPNPSAASYSGELVCTLEAHRRTAQVRLTSPLGERVVVDPREVRDVPVSTLQ